MYLDIEFRYAQIFWLSGLVFRALILTCFIRTKFKIYLLFQICDLQIYDIAFKSLAKFRQKMWLFPLYLAFDLALMTKVSWCKNILSLHHSKWYLNQIYYFGSVFNLNWSIMEKLFIVIAHLQFGQPSRKIEGIYVFLWTSLILSFSSFQTYFLGISSAYFEMTKFEYWISE